MTTLSNTRAAVLVLEGADAIGLPHPRYIAISDHTTALRFQFATPDEVAEWADAHDAEVTVRSLRVSAVTSTTVDLTIYDVPVECYAHGQAPDA